MLKKIAIGLVAVIVVLIVVIAVQPSSYTVERATKIEAPPNTVYGVLADLNRFTSWSPFLKVDPNAKVTVTGPVGQVGHKYEWDGNDEVGAGSMAITSIEAGKSVTVDLHFVRPFESKAKVTWTVAPDGEGTTATWGMEAQNDFIGKAMCLVFPMEEMLGKQFDEGLANLKRVVEQEAAKAASAVAEAPAAEPAAPQGEAVPAAEGAAAKEGEPAVEKASAAPPAP